MKAYNLVLSRFFKASVSVTLYECPWHPYIESTDSLIIYDHAGVHELPKAVKERTSASYRKINRTVAVDIVDVAASR